MDDSDPLIQHGYSMTVDDLATQRAQVHAVMVLS